MGATMAIQRRPLAGLIVAIAVMCVARFAQGQATPPQPASASASQEAARRQFLESDRWRRARRDFDNWIATQRLYTADEVAAIRAKLAARIDTMSPGELQSFLEEMEDRLDVLTSPAAEEARQWVGQFLATARNAEEQLQAKRPDVLHMTASEIRAELERFQRQRASRQQAHAATANVRAAQVQSAQATQAARQQAQAQAQDARSRAAAGAQEQIQAPPPSQRANTSHATPLDNRPPYFYVSPWGTPIRWNPMLGQW